VLLGAVVGVAFQQARIGVREGSPSGHIAVCVGRAQL
jgi:hypothetical protein